MSEIFEHAAPVGPDLTDYDRAHIKLYMRLLDATAEGADWREVTSVLFGVDANIAPERAQMLFNSHLDRARWMAEVGYKQLATPVRK